MVSDRERAELEEKKAASLGQLLLKCGRLLNEQAVARIRARTGMQLRPAHTALFPHIDLEGTRLTDLANRLGISKQAVGPLVAELVEMGALEQVPDPTDGRAKLVRFPAHGDRNSLFAGLAVLEEFEDELAVREDVATVRGLHTGLTALLRMLLDAESSSDG